jgi:hypothetical protein
MEIVTDWSPDLACPFRPPIATEVALGDIVRHRTASMFGVHYWIILIGLNLTLQRFRKFLPHLQICVFKFGKFKQFIKLKTRRRLHSLPLSLQCNTLFTLVYLSMSFVWGKRSMLAQTGWTWWCQDLDTITGSNHNTGYLLYLWSAQPVYQHCYEHGGMPGGTP